MNPWKSTKWKKIYKNSDVRTGLRLRFDKGVNIQVKENFKEFSKWLRNNYCFPIRVNVYIKDCDKVQLLSGRYAYGSFWYPIDNMKEPHIRIPSGDFKTRADIVGNDNAIEEILSSLVHELTHYYQWVNQTEQTDRASEWQANYYRYRIIDIYNGK